MAIWIPMERVPLMQQDLSVNTRNWQLTHSLYTGAAEGSNASGNELYFERAFPSTVSSDTVSILGDTLQLNHYFADTTNPVTVQGVTYRVRYDADVLSINNPDLAVYNGWMNDDAILVYYRARTEGRKGLVHFVTSRLDQGNYTGGGQKGTIEFKVNPNAFVNADTMYTDICFEEFKAVQADGTVLNIGAECITLAYTDPTYNAITILADETLIRLYPNPARTAIQLELDQVTAKRVILMDVLGQVIQQHTQVQGTLTIHRGNLPEGVYLIQVELENGRQSTHKVVFR